MNHRLCARAQRGGRKDAYVVGKLKHITTASAPGARPLLRSTAPGRGSRVFINQAHDLVMVIVSTFQVELLRRR
jgi:hypothetical protein